MAGQLDSALSSAEQRLWFQWQLRPGGSEYNTPMAYRLTGRLDVPALRRAVDRLAARHDVLRTRFPAIDGVTRHVEEPGPVPWTVTDLRTEGAGERERRLADALRRSVNRPFDLVHGPVFRAELFQVDSEQHVLLLVFHHIAVDGWSLDIVARDLRAGYLSAGDPSAEDQPAGRYTDHVAAEREMLAGPRPGAAVGFWRTELAGAPAGLSLPADRPPPRNPGPGADAYPFTLPASVRDSVRAVIGAHRVTPFLTMLTAWAVALATTTGTDDVVIGIPATGRTSMDAERTVGLFVNMLPLRVRVDRRETFAGLLRQVRESFLAAYEYEDFPFQRLVEELAPPRTGNRHPLFQAVFSYQDRRPDEFALPGLTTERLSFPTETAKYEITLDAEWGPDHAAGSIGYQSEVVDAGVATLLAGRFTQVLAAGTAEPDRPLDELPLVPPGETEMLLGLDGGPVVATEPVHLSVRRHAKQRPDTAAVRDGDRTLTYAQLDAAATRLAGDLAGAGVPEDAVVAVCLPRSPELVTAALGVLYAGAAYLPLDPAHPVRRRAAVLEGAGPVAAVITDAEHAGDFPGRTVVMVPPDGDARSPGGPAPRVGDRAYLIFTSGSTGRPKGVVAGHASLANLAAWYRSLAGLGPGEAASLVAAPGFDASALELWGALAAGATLDIPDRETVLSPAGLRDWLVHRRIALACLPTPLAERVLDLPWPGKVTLRALLAGGDRLRHPAPPGLPFRFINGYGPTESTVAATCATVEPGDDRAPAIGRPIPGVRAVVLDRDLRLTPAGLVGELYLGGPALALGYAGGTGATADRFVPDPYGPPGARLYRTGDLVRLRTDRMLHFVGRSDTQLKVRGFRIEPAEIETALRGRPGVADAVVSVEPGATGEGVLTAYLVPDGGAVPEPTDLRRHLAEVVPQYMVPARYLTVPRWPLTPNGKLDRTALSREARELSDHRPGRTGPQSPLERMVARVWAQVLGHDAITADDNFFDLGGHSLQLMTVRDRLSEQLSRPLPIVALYEHPTVRALARHLDAAAPRTEPDRAVVRESQAGLLRLASLRTARGGRSSR
ncbi:hypothetical protein Asp14428_16940 [Actinoplanes sp. NBRC 14428]|nr:hypothetical protein Asp14428_16940 [Actinoplanes sp. NBRC 14428]